MTGEEARAGEAAGGVRRHLDHLGSTFLAIRFGVESIPPFLMAGVRSVAAGGILWSWARMRGT